MEKEGSIMPGFHWARLHRVLAVTQFCSILCVASYPTGSVSETERFARAILLTCSDFVDFVIFP